MKSLLGLLLVTGAASLVLAADADPTRALPSGKVLEDRRLGKAKTLNDYFPFDPPANRAAWEARRKELREQVQVATGLWPLPPKTPLNPVIHGKIDRDGYTIEKVFFASYPGHHVCGNLYRPKAGADGTAKSAGVLCPHGHWANGRFYDAGDKGAQAQVDQGAEKTLEGAHYPLQARCAQLARMGCVVFHYDMVGYADSQQIGHRTGFTDAEAELRLQSFLGLQTWNSIRALDFLLGLPDVDAKRIGVTGASGGGTQTFILGAIDDRLTAAFPAVMVSTAMQGGCVCENCSYLRVGTGNIELAGLFAPKPLGMSGADDWTKEIETKGLPELKALYRLYNAEDKVLARAFPQFKHNYNQVSREVMYNWFNKHLQLGLPEPVVEKPFVPVPPKELSVYDDQHPRPADAGNAETLRKYMTEASDQQLAELRKLKDLKGLTEYHRVIGTALRVMLDFHPADFAQWEAKGDTVPNKEGFTQRNLLLLRRKQNEATPAIELRGTDFNGTMVVWVDPAGKASLFQSGKLVPAARRILDQKAGILAVDVFGTGELRPTTLMTVNTGYAGFTFGYNRTLLANRVNDIMSGVPFLMNQKDVKTIHLVGFDKAGPWVVLAKAMAGKAVSHTAADLHQFRFDKVTATADEMMQPGALKYGGLPAFAALCAPGELYLHNVEGGSLGRVVKDAYAAAGKPAALQESAGKVAADKVIDQLLR